METKWEPVLNIVTAENTTGSNGAETLHPPYLNAELYRGQSSKSTRLFPQHFDVIHIAPDGKALVGRSNLIGRLWNGVVQTVDTPLDLTNVMIQSANLPIMTVSNGIGDAKFMLDTTKVVIGDDAGDLMIWSRQPLWSSVTKPGDEYDAWCISCNSCEHDDGILSLDTSILGDKIVTGGADNCIKVWDFSLISTVTYRPAHTHIVSNVACNPKENDVLISSSLDGSIVLWDTRCLNNKTQALTTMSCGARCICWLSEKYFVVGCENGDVALYNVAHASKMFTINLNFPIHKIIYNDSIKCLALCGDSNELIIYKVREDMNMKEIYKDTRHTDSVRGISWDNNEPVNLYSCGWDSKILKHSFLYK